MEDDLILNAAVIARIFYKLFGVRDNANKISSNAGDYGFFIVKVSERCGDNRYVRGEK